MHGTIHFDCAADLVEFLIQWTGKSTATFDVQPNRQRAGAYIMTFEGGF